MEFRRAMESDYAQLVALQEAYSVANLPENERGDGFLSATFSEKELRRMNEDLCIVVAAEHGTPKGMLCAGTTELNKSYGLPAAMIARYPEVSYRGKPLDEWVSYISGPVVIDKSARGTGAFGGMYREQFRIVPRQYELVVTLINSENQRSLHAHGKIGYEPIDGFTYGGKQFILLVLETSRQL